MNTHKFTKNLESVLKVFESSKLSSRLLECNFTTSELALALKELAQTASQTALSLEELELKDRQMALEEEKTRQELELASLNAKAQNKIHLSEALKSLVQSESMAKSLTHNAQINRANAYVGFLNVVGNAASAAAIAPHSSSVVSAINNISLDKLEQYSPLFDNLKGILQEALKGGGNKEVFIYAPKMTIEVGETLRLLGCHTFGDNPSKFIIDGKETIGKNVNVCKEEAGVIAVEFKAQNTAREWISDRMEIKVIAP